jgi:beta-galactosidase
VNAPLPGLLADVCGVEVEEYDALHPDVHVPLTWEEIGATTGLPGVSASLWCDILAPSSAQIVARYLGEFYAQRAAITLNRFGQGHALYVGSLGDSDLHDAVVEWAVQTASISPAFATPGGVEATERWQNGKRFLFLLNHTDRAHEIRLSQAMTDLLSEQSVDGRVTLEPNGVMVLRS